VVKAVEVRVLSWAPSFKIPNPEFRIRTRLDAGRLKGVRHPVFGQSRGVVVRVLAGPWAKRKKSIRRERISSPDSLKSLFNLRF
jgi:hypothetical protein